MNSELINKRLVPKQAVIIYEEKSQYSTEFYLETREIEKKDGRYLFMAPQPMPKDTMKKIAGSFIKRNSLEMEFGGLISAHLLMGINRPGTLAVLWYRPAMLKNLNFSASLDIKGDKTVSIPATLYLVLNQSLYVFALASDDRPGQATKLYNAPFFNIYEDGRVCLGTAKIGKTRSRTFELEADRFERGFYMAEQNGGNLVPCKTDLKALWRQQIKKGEPFPIKQELLQHKKFKTLGDLIDKMVGNN